MTVSARSYLVAGLVAATVGTAAVAQVNPAGRTAVDALSLRSSGFDLTAAVAPLIQPFTAAALGLADGAAALYLCCLRPAAAAVVDPSVADPSVADSSAVAAATGSAGEAIINIFNTVEPFVQYGFELTAWAAGYLPWPIGWLGQQINIAYNTGEPIVQALVYSFAYLIDGQFDLIGPTLAFGFNLAVTNFVQGEINWVLSFRRRCHPYRHRHPFPTAAVASRAAVSGPACQARRTARPPPFRNSPCCSSRGKARSRSPPRKPPRKPQRLLPPPGRDSPPSSGPGRRLRQTPRPPRAAPKPPRRLPKPRRRTAPRSRPRRSPQSPPRRSTNPAGRLDRPANGPVPPVHGPRPGLTERRVSSTGAAPGPPASRRVATGSVPSRPGFPARRRRCHRQGRRRSIKPPLTARTTAAVPQAFSNLSSTPRPTPVWR